MWDAESRLPLGTAVVPDMTRLLRRGRPAVQLTAAALFLDGEEAGGGRWIKDEAAVPPPSLP